MLKFTTGRGLRLLLAAGICLGTLASVGAVSRTDGTASPMEAVVQQAEQKSPIQTEAELKAAEARQKRAPALLASRGLNREQKDALTARMGEDAFLFQLLEQGSLTRADLLWLTLPNSRSDRLERYRAWSAEHPKLTAEDAVLQVNMDQDQDFYSLIWEVADPSALDVLVNKHYILPAGYVPQLEALGGKYGAGSLRPEAAQAFRAMADSARKDGISLRSVSAYRSYRQQTNTYNRYLKQNSQATVDTFSARPGHSEHQTGLALDINVASSRAHFEDTPAFAWLKEHCAEYGFILRYDLGQDSITGYRFEPWHYRYVGQEAAKTIMEQGITYEEYLALRPTWGQQVIIKEETPAASPLSISGSLK